MSRRSNPQATGAGPHLDLVAAVARHSQGFAGAADGNLAAPVEGCPGWDVAELVRHLTEVQWFWATIVEERLSDRPDDSRRPDPVADDLLLDTFRKGAQRLTEVLATADPLTPVWTWAPARQDAGFVIRHQAQEAAVHHFDAARARGLELAIEPALAADAIDEFLTFSISSQADPADPPRPALGGRLGLICSDVEASWTVLDDATPGTLRFLAGVAQGVPAVRATASELLLWLYQRIQLEGDHLDPALEERFRALCFTD